MQIKFPNHQLPSFAQCMVHFHALRELFGEQLWQKAKSRASLRARIQLYEKLSYQPYYSKEFIGDESDFCLGYIYVYKKSKRKLTKDKDRRLKQAEFLQILSF